MGRWRLRVVAGKRAVQASMPAEASRVVVDVGAGDGRWAYESAKADPATLYVALDPDADALAEYAFRASRKPARGGSGNALFVVASIEAPPDELRGRAAEVKVLFPWAALLRGLLQPDEAVLRGLRALAAPGATFELVLTYDPSHDHGAGLDLPGLDEAGILGLREPYLRCGLQIVAVRRLEREEALAIPSTWGRRLLHGRERYVYRVEGHFL